MFPGKRAKEPYTPKPYEQMAYPGQRVQVKVVPRRCITDPELRLFLYTAARGTTARAQPQEGPKTLLLLPYPFLFAGF